MAYLLSLCIPTYNRADVLDQALRTLLGDPDFDSAKIEVVVSDNCSTDHTQQIAAQYPSVHYFRNEENVGDENFSRALRRGQGAYVKLMGDTVRMRSGGLRKILAGIEANLDSKLPLFFIERGGLSRRVTCPTLEDFVDRVSYRITWIGNFGVWQRDLPIVEDLSERASNLLQVAWSCRLSASGPVKVYTSHYCTVASINAASKGGYNLFKVFIDNYLTILRKYLDTGTLTTPTFEREKRRLFKGYIHPHIQRMQAGAEELKNFQMEGAWESIMRNFGEYPYFHLAMLRSSLRRHK